MSEINPFQDTMKRLDEVQALAEKLPAELWGVTKEQLEVLKHEKRAILINFPLKTAKGTRIINAYRVQYNDALGPTKGGIRFHHEVDLDEVKALALWMALKNSLLGLPYGGGKGGVTINPKEFSKAELEQISREYIRQLHKFIGPTIDVPAPDVYTTPEIMGWMVDEYEKIKGEHLPGVITGKPLSIGGSEGRSFSTGLGAYYVLREAMKAYKLDPKKSRAAVHGFGNAGMEIAKVLFEKGYKVIAVADSRGAVLDEKGLDIKKLIAHKEKSGAVKDFAGAKNISGDKLLELELEVLAPASLNDIITSKNMKDVKAKIILEVGNGPVSTEADDYLFKKGVIILPDILSNAGGVTVSYFEWMQNLTGDHWDEKTVLDRLDKMMTGAFHTLLDDYVKPYKLSFRTAAYIRAIRRIVQAEKDRGRV